MRKRPGKGSGKGGRRAPSKKLEKNRCVFFQDKKEEPLLYIIFSYNFKFFKGIVVGLYGFSIQNNPSNKKITHNIDLI